MLEKNKKILVTFLWGIVMIVVMFLFIYINGDYKEADTMNESTNENVIVYDGSEYNPEIKGVQ